MVGGEIIQSKYEKGVYIVRGQQWVVGERYELQKILGEGSFSCVCLAKDNILGQQVALKRIADVLYSIDYAKRVLREICILRRIRHPNMIGLKDAFIRPASTGRLKFQGGKLVPTSIDLYLALEYANGGDLFHLKGQLSEQDVKHMLWQLTNAMKFLHDLHVWHRDLKSANVLINIEDGLRVLKIADFGSARSATRTGYNVAEQKAPQTTTLVEEGNQKLELPQRLVSLDSMVNIPQLSPDVYDKQIKQFQSGVTAPLTRVICTPCYRAPEVVMSRGGYGSAIDIWSLGCIFGELLHRVARLGSAATPNLQISPVFAIYGEQGMMKTPETGERFTDGPSCPTTRRELEALFQVIGTPTWACIEGVQSSAWKKYLQKLPGRAPTLSRRFGKAGEVGVDLLRRLLTFDPQRRPSAEEVLTHEYFFGCTEEYETLLDDPCLISVQVSHEIALPKDPQQRHYFNVKDPAKALATLEDELEKLILVEDGVDVVRHFIEMECAEIQKERDLIAAQPPDQRCCNSVENEEQKPNLKRDSPSPATPRSRNRFLRNPSLGHMGDPSEWQGLQVDPNPLVQDPSLIGEDRLKRNGYSARSKLDLEEHLFFNRMADWTVTTGKDLERDNGPRWGVSYLPPGMDDVNMDPNVLEVISSQQAR